MNIFTKYKKVFLIIVFLLLIAAIGYLIFLLFFKSGETTTTNQGANSTATTTNGQLPTANNGQGQVINGETGGNIPSTGSTANSNGQQASPTANGGLTKVDTITSETLNPSMTSNGSVEYYNKTDGKFYRIDKNNQITALSDKVFHDVQNIVWSPTSDKAVIEYPDGSKIVYDFTSKKQTTLPKHWEDFNFSPDGQTLVMKSMGIDTETRYLAISSSDGSSQKIIDTIGDNGNNIYPSWSPNNEIIAMDVEGVDADRQEVYFVGLNDENFKSTIIEGRGFQSTWSTSGDKLLYSVYSSTSDYKPSLWIVNAQGDNIGTGRTSLNINTWASKCTFTSNETVYCGVPESLDTGSGLIPEMAQNSKDDLYKINVATGNKELVAVPNGSYNMSNLSVSPDGTSLYFTDANDSKLHKVTLK